MKIEILNLLSEMDPDRCKVKISLNENKDVSISVYEHADEDTKYVAHFYAELDSMPHWVLARLLFYGDSELDMSIDIVQEMFNGVKETLQHRLSDVKGFLSKKTTKTDSVAATWRTMQDD